MADPQGWTRVEEPSGWTRVEPAAPVYNGIEGMSVMEMGRRSAASGNSEIPAEASVLNRLKEMVTIRPSPTGDRMENAQQLVPFLLPTGTGIASSAAGPARGVVGRAGTALVERGDRLAQTPALDRYAPGLALGAAAHSIPGVTPAIAAIEAAQTPGVNRVVGRLLQRVGGVKPGGASIPPAAIPPTAAEASSARGVSGRPPRTGPVGLTERYQNQPPIGPNEPWLPQGTPEPFQVPPPKPPPPPPPPRPQLALPRGQYTGPQTLPEPPLALPPGPPERLALPPQRFHAGPQTLEQELAGQPPPQPEAWQQFATHQQGGPTAQPQNPPTQHGPVKGTLKMSPQQALNEEALARRRAEYQARQAAPEQSPAEAFNKKYGLPQPTPEEMRFRKGMRGKVRRKEPLP